MNKFFLISSVLWFSSLIPTLAWANGHELTFESAEREYEAINRSVPVQHTPLPTLVQGVQNPIMSLNGSWLFNPTPPEGFELLDDAARQEGWEKVQIPAEWYMPGYRVPKNGWAGYFRTFLLPDDWAGQSVILRFGAVESECRVVVNGHEVGNHIGSMVPFEFDVTSCLKPGINTVSLLVRSESAVSSIARISHYAKHQVGGILRDVVLFAVPTTHVADLFCQTTLSDDLQEGQIKVHMKLAGRQPDTPLKARFTLKKYGVEGLPREEGIVLSREVELPQGSDLCLNGITIAKPELWHAERPWLYQAELSLDGPAGPLQTIRRFIGFRKIAIEGNVLMVNNKPVKLRGVAHHDIHPYYGRAIPDRTILEQDVRLFRDANCNYIRTSHYTPDEFLVELCDRYGIFLEDEASCCWDWNTAASSRERTKLVLHGFKSMLMRDREHPCVLIWSLANECRWAPRYIPCLKLAKETTPDIPVKFSHSEYFGVNRALDVGTKHYPGWKGLFKYDNYFRPIVFDEALHLNCYNSSENMTDPGLRDLWGDYASYFVDNMQSSPAISGLAVWCGIDEIYYPKNEKPIMGGGPWGVVDGFRRPKPEYWHMKMAYSPVKITSRHFQSMGNYTAVSVENRYNTLNLNQLVIEWQDGAQTGSVQADVNPTEQGTILIPHRMQGDELVLRFKDKRGFEVTAAKLPRHPAPHYRMPQLASEHPPVLAEQNDTIVVRSADVTFQIPKATGLPEHITKGGKELVSNGFRMYAIPLIRENQVVDFIPIDDPNNKTYFASPALANWKLDSMEWAKEDKLVRFYVKGHYGKTPVSFIYAINGNGKLRVDYTINLKQIPYECRQIGVGFDLPRSFDTLNWQRLAPWTIYPDDHIGRPSGTAKALYPATLDHYLTRWETPTHPWAHDGNPYGSNDFRSTKHNLVTGSLNSQDGQAVSIESNGRQHLRAWINQNHISFILAQYSNGGAEHYLQYDSERTLPPLKDESGEFPGWAQFQF